MKFSKLIMRGRLKKLLFIVGIATVTGIFMQFTVAKFTFNESVLPVKKEMPPFYKSDTVTTDSLLSGFSLEEKIGQMFMVASYPKMGEADKQRVASLIRKHKVGGVIFFQGTPEQVDELASYFQSISETPLLMAIDGEWGLAFRLKNTIKYPNQMMLGAITDDMLIYNMGRDIAKQLRLIGVHVNFAPVIDINNNQANPVINSRSFGEDRVNVARKGILYMKGMQDAGVLAFAKHFPGHGDTETDSHFGLPIVNHSIQRLDSLELYPFRALINAGVGGVMVAHMNVLSLDTTVNRASTLSPKIVDSLLIKRLGFKGLIATDAMNMKGVSQYYSPVEANLQAIIAGNDILLIPHDEEKSIQAIKKAIEKGDISVERIETSARKILQAKKWIFKQSEIESYSYKELNKEEYYLTRKKLIEASLTVVENKNNMIPFRELDTLKIAHVKLGPGNGNKFSETLKLYSQIDVFSANASMDEQQLLRLRNKLENYNVVLLSLHSSSINAKKNFNISDKDILLIQNLIADNPTVLVGFLNPYVLSRIENLNDCLAIVESYENNYLTQSATAQLIFGATGASGKLPVSINSTYKAGVGINTKVLERFKYVSAFEAGFDQEKLAIIDSIINDAIAERAIPGCQILAAKDGMVFFNKSYGYHTYRKKKPVSNQDIYDLASLTKISATLPSIIRLQKEKKINIDNKLVTYFPSLDTCEKKDLILSDILLHQSGLAAWIPFYWSTLEPVYPDQELTSKRYSATYPINIGTRVYANKHLKYKKDYFVTDSAEGYRAKVADHLFLRDDIQDSMWYKIAASPLGETGKYRYSDLGFYLFYKIIEERTKIEFTAYLDSVFYKPLGANSLCFNPVTLIDKDKIVPTENDLVFRKQLVHGYVHDPGAAMLGGVSGHAGLFGNANDLAKLMQMYLNGGRYGGKQYLSRKLVKKFSSCVACNNGNRRGLGFDKPQPDTTKSGPGFKGISTDSFGHTGFTGTMVWMDPSTGILYIFLSNRVYPDAMNNKLITMDVRTNIQKAIYDARIENKNEAFVNKQ